MIHSEHMFNDYIHAFKSTVVQTYDDDDILNTGAFVAASKYNDPSWPPNKLYSVADFKWSERKE